jgi:hypothetical protein
MGASTEIKATATAREVAASKLRLLREVSQKRKSDSAARGAKAATTQSPDKTSAGR